MCSNKEGKDIGDTWISSGTAGWRSLTEVLDSPNSNPEKVDQKEREMNVLPFQLVICVAVIRPSSRAVMKTRSPGTRLELEELTTKA